MGMPPTNEHSRCSNPTPSLTSIIEPAFPSTKPANEKATRYHDEEVWRAAITEVVGTATLMFTLITSSISCLDTHVSDPKLLIPIAVFVTVFLFILVTAPLSGGHMNQAFTFIAALKGLISPRRATIYVAAQCLGSLLGFLAVKSVLSYEAIKRYALGGCLVVGTLEHPGIGVARALMLEFSCTFLVLFVAVSTGFDKRRSEALGLPKVSAVVAGSVSLAVFISTTVTERAGYTGIGMNPGRCLAPALLHGGALWNGHWVFWVGPFFACIVYYGYCKSMPNESFMMEGGEYDFWSWAEGWKMKNEGKCFVEHV